MEQLSLYEIVKATNAEIEESQIPNLRPKIVFGGISTDSRTTRKGDLFFALKGPHYDGHHFINDAISNGAKGVVVDAESNIMDCGLLNDKSRIEGCVIRVYDTVKALGDLARFYRTKMPAKIIAITGSNGKTTTKDMVYHLLFQEYDTIKSKASFNNLFGVPLTIFDLDFSHRFGIVEMGTNAFGEISRLSEIAFPDVAVITNIGESHLEGLKDIDGVKKEKSGVVKNIKDGGVLLVNADDKRTIEIGEEFQGEVVTFGVSNKADIMASNINRTPEELSFVINEKYKVVLPITGYHNIYNCLAAFAVINALGIEIRNVANAFDGFRLSPQRMEKERVVIKDERLFGQNDSNLPLLGKDFQVTVINDAYNANPNSMRAVIKDFNTMLCNGRKIFVSGDMLELGAESERLHYEIGKEIGLSTIDVLWTVGEMGNFVKEGALETGMSKEKILCFAVVEDLSNSLLQYLKVDDTILLKGSRAMKLEKVVAGIKSYSDKNLHLLAG